MLLSSKEEEKREVQGLCGVQSLSIWLNMSQLLYAIVIY